MATIPGWLNSAIKAVTPTASSGPAIAAIVDVDTTATHNYVLTSPVISATDRITLESGTASDADVMALIAQHGGIAVNHLDATIVLEGHRPSLRIVNIQPQVSPVRTAMKAAFLNIPSAGEVSVIPVTSNLDRDTPVLEAGSGPYFDSHQIDLARGERESLRVSFQTTTGYHQFNLLITYVTAGKQHKQTIPWTFRLIGAATDYRSYPIVYAGLTGNQFEVANKSQLCTLFPRSQGC